MTTLTVDIHLRHKTSEMRENSTTIRGVNYFARAANKL